MTTAVFFLATPCVAYGVLVPWPGIKPAAPAEQGGVSTVDRQGSPDSGSFIAINNVSDTVTVGG